MQPKKMKLAKMKLARVGFVGWRGMVGSVLLQRMRAEDDFAAIAEPYFFTTSQAGQAGPDIGRDVPPLIDAHDIDALAKMDAVVTCQGGDYTKAVHPQLRARGWGGYWIDAASALRMRDDAVIVLDPVNLPLIERAIANGGKDFIGGNCTVSLMLMALAGLFKHDLIEWLTVATYQAISGGGAKQMRELVAQMGAVHHGAEKLLADPASSILAVDEAVTDTMRSAKLPVDEIGAPLAGGLLPWIDADLESGVSREEWKGAAETNKILGRAQSTGATAAIAVESVCVRVGVMRCHSQAFTIKLTKDIPLDEISEMLATAHEWITITPNTRGESLAQLTPAAVSGTLDIVVGRLRKLSISGSIGGSINDGGGYLSAFTVGDQLLWGAAEPLRRMLRLLQHA